MVDGRSQGDLARRTHSRATLPNLDPNQGARTLSREDGDLRTSCEFAGDTYAAPTPRRSAARCAEAGEPARRGSARFTRDICARDRSARLAPTYMDRSARGDLSPARESARRLREIPPTVALEGHTWTSCEGPIGCFCSFGLSLRDW